MLHALLIPVPSLISGHIPCVCRESRWPRSHCLSWVLSLMPSEYWPGYAALHHSLSVHSAPAGERRARQLLLRESPTCLFQSGADTVPSGEGAGTLHTYQTKRGKMVNLRWCAIFFPAVWTSMGNLNTSLHQTLVLTCLPSLTLVLPLRATMHGYALQALSDSSSAMDRDDWSQFPHLGNRDKN